MKSYRGYRVQGTSVLLWLAAAGFAAPAVMAQAQNQAAARNRLTMEDVLRWRLASDPALSPDGRRVAYVVSENDLEKSRVLTHLWWVDTQTRQTRRLTQTDDGVAEPRWSPDGRWLAFLSARGDEPDSPPQVWLLSVEGGESFALTRAPKGVMNFRWVPDSKGVYYVAQENPPPAVSTLRDAQQKRKDDAFVVDEERPRREIWRAKVEDRSAERISAGDPGLDSIEPSPDGKWLVFRTNQTGEPDDETKLDLWLLDLASHAIKPLTRRTGEERSPVWSPDSLRVAFLAPRVPELRYSQEEVFVVPIAWPGEQPPAPQRLTKDFSGSIEEIHWPSKANGIYFVAAARTTNRLYSLNLVDGVVQPASSEKAFLTFPDCSGEAAACVALMEGPDALPEVVLLRPATVQAEPQRLTDLNPQLRNFSLPAQEVIRWKSKDGKEIEGVLMKPPDWQPGKKYPLLLDIHGGPYGRRAPVLQAPHHLAVFASRGWLVLEPNYRGSSAYGNEFGLASRNDLGGADAQDILAGVDFVIAQGWADAQRMAVMGESYGGYMTNWLISQTPRFRAAVSLFGIFSLITDFSNSDYPSWETDYLGHPYWDNLQLYLDRSPLKFVKQITTPALILHGEADNNTFISNSKEMYQALKLLGRPVKFVRFPREGHGFVEPRHVLAQFRQIAAWLEEYVPGAPAERARIANEAVRSGPWELRVADVSTPENYSGVAAKGRFVEVALLLRAVAPVEGRFSLLLFDNAGSEVSLLAGERTIYPEGLVSESLGQRLLVKSSGQVVAIAPDRNGNHTALAVTVAFDAPAGPREFLLKVKDFPPIKIELPLE